MISEYPFSQLMLANGMNLQGASLQLNRYSAKASNAADFNIRRTSGEATLSDFIVAPHSQSSGSRLIRRSSNSGQGRNSSIAKGGYLDIIT